MDSFRDALWLLRRTPVLETGLADALQEAVHAVTALPMDAPVAIDMALYDTALHAGTAGPADRAHKLLRLTAVLNPGHAGTYRSLAQSAHADGALEEATRLWRRSLRLEDDWNTRFALAVLLYKQGRPDEAIEQYDLLITHGQNLGAALINRAVIRYQRRDVEGAVEDALRALQLDASCQQAFNLLVNLGRWPQPGGAPPDFQTHLLEAARRNFTRAEFHQALYLTGRLRQTDPTNVEALALAFASVVETGRFDHARRFHWMAHPLFAGLEPGEGAALRFATTNLRLCLALKDFDGAQRQLAALPDGARGDAACALCALELQWNADQPSSDVWKAAALSVADRLENNPVALHHAARALWSAGHPADAEVRLRRILTALPNFREAWETLTAVLDDTGRHDDAMQVARDNRKLSDALEARHVCGRLAAHVGKPPPRPRAAKPGHRIAMSRLGGLGRFGNQVFQYAFLRTYAAVHGLTAEAPEWAGRYLFGHDDPLARGDLPQKEEDDTLPAGLQGTASPDFAGHDLFGFFQFHTSHYAPHRPFIRSLFSPVGTVRERLDRAEATLRGRRNRDVIAIHVRRGDFGSERFWTYDERHYISWIRAVASQFHHPVLYVASDDASVAERFRAFDCVTASDIWEPLEGAEFLLDHYMLGRADAVSISNSSFSFSATLLNERARLFTRPKGPDRPLVRFDPWNDLASR